MSLKWILNLKTRLKLQLIIYDLYGKLVYNSNHGELQAGTNTLSFDVNDLATGTYIVSVLTNGTQFGSGKFVVSK